MAVWFRYVVRLMAAIVLSMLVAVLTILAITTKDGRAFSVGLGALLAAATFATWPRHPTAWRSDRPTKRQLAYARDLGIDVPPAASRGQVSDLISAATGR